MPTKNAGNPWIPGVSLIGPVSDANVWLAGALRLVGAGPRPYGYST